MLEQRGVLSPEEIHRLASKTRTRMGGRDTKAACHSDQADAGVAKQLQEEQLVQIDTAPAHNLPKHDPVI